MCCVLSVPEAGKQPEKPKSKTSRQFSISTIKFKSLAKLSKEFRLRTTNEKGMTQLGLCSKEKKVKHFMILDKVSCTALSRCYFQSSEKPDPTYCHLSSYIQVLILWHPGYIKMTLEREIKSYYPPLPIHT